MVLPDDFCRDVIAMVAIRCGTDETRVTKDLDLYEQLGMDSLDFLGMAQMLQDRYAVLFDNESVAAIRTVGDLLTFLEKQLVARSSESVPGTGGSA
jgi:acyl carrier protein